MIFAGIILFAASIFGYHFKEQQMIENNLMVPVESMYFFQFMGFMGISFVLAGIPVTIAGFLHKMNLFVITISSVTLISIWVLLIFFKGS